MLVMMVLKAQREGDPRKRSINLWKNKKLFDIGLMETRAFNDENGQ